MNDPTQTVDEPGRESGPPVLVASTSTHIGRYRIERVQGQGGFGLVYLAHDDQLRRFVAIKVPHSRLVARPEDAEAYLAEARTVALGDLHLDRRTETVCVLAPSPGDRVSALPLVVFGIGILICWAYGFTNDRMRQEMTERFWPIVGSIVGLGLSCAIAVGAILLGLEIITQSVRFDNTASARADASVRK